MVGEDFASFMKCLQGFGVQFKRTFEYALQVADCYAVVGHRDVLTLGLSQTREHMAASDDAAAALQNEFVRREVHGEVFADYNFNVEFSADFFSEPAR